jgi:predicted Zn-dependent peptidase
MTDTGSFVTQAGVRTDKAVEALKVILEEYDRVMDEPIGEDELHKAKQMLRGQLLIGLEETNALAIFGGMQQLLKGKVMKPAEIVKQIDKVTAKQIQGVAQKLLAPKKRAVALLGPQKSAGRFEKLLK